MANEMVWPGLIGPGIHLVIGPAGCGKGLFAVRLAAAVSIGGMLPDGERAAPGKVLIYAPDDGQDIDRRFRRLNELDHENIFVVRAGDYPMAGFAQSLVTMRNIRLMVIDPWDGFLSAPSDVRMLARLAKNWGVAVLITDCDYRSAITKAVERASGSAWSIMDHGLPNRTLHCTKGPGKGRGFIFNASAGTFQATQCLWPNKNAAYASAEGWGELLGQILEAMPLSEAQKVHFLEKHRRESQINLPGQDSERNCLELIRRDLYAMTGINVQVKDFRPVGRGLGWRFQKIQVTRPVDDSTVIENKE